MKVVSPYGTRKVFCVFVGYFLHAEHIASQPTVIQYTVSVEDLRESEGSKAFSV